MYLLTEYKKDFFALVNVAFPLIVTGVLQSSVFFIINIFLARLGQEHLAASALGGCLFGTLVVFIVGLLSSINVLVALKFGEKQYQEIGLILRDGLLIAITLAIIIMIILWNIYHLFVFLGQSTVVVNLTNEYIRASVWELFPFFISMALTEFLTGLGNTRPILFISIFNVILSICLAYIFIFGKFGIPVLGISGAGWAVSLSALISLVVWIIYFVFKKEYFIYFRPLFTFHKLKYFYELLQIGTPMGLMFLLEVAFFLVLALLMGYYGSIYLTANQIVFQFICFIFSVVFSVAQALTSCMGQQLGAKDINAARRTNIFGVSISFGFILFVSLFYWFKPGWIIAIDFNIHDQKNSALIKLTTELLKVCILFQIFEAVRITLFGALRAFKDTKFPLLVSLIGFWFIALPVGYLLSTYTRLIGVGQWWGMTLGAFISMSLLIWRINFKIKERSE